MRPRLPADLDFEPFGAGDQPPGSLDPYLARLARLGGPLSLLRLIRDLAGFADTICRQLPAALDRLGPDALVIDQTDAAASLVATALPLPFVNIANALPLNLELAVPPPVLPWPYDPSPRGLRRNLGGYRVARFVERPITKVIRRHAVRLGRPEIRFADQAWSDRAQITQCVRELDFPREQLPSGFHYVGPIRGPDEPLDFELKDDGRPLIFCSLGTLQGSRAGIFHAVAKAASELDATLLIAHGGLLPEREIARLAGRPIVRPYVLQRAVLARASLAITHAGFNTVMDALSYGVPMVALPIAFEQPATGARLERVGAARVLHRRRTPARIRDAIREVLGDPSYRTNARGLQAEIASAGGVTRAADILEAGLA
jgi:zeaxanthin glucosyltransferase